MPKIVKFMKREWNVARSTYRNGHAALLLVPTDPMLAQDASEYATASTNLVDASLGTNEIHIKTWSENEGMLDALIEAKVVTYTGKLTPTGYALAPICTLILNDGDAVTLG